MCAVFVKMCVTIVKTCGSLLCMEISNTEIARCGLCTEGTVRAAKSNGRLDASNAESVFGFILGMRVKELGLSAFDGLASPVDELKAGGALRPAGELHYERDHENDETIYEGGLYATG